MDRRSAAYDISAAGMAEISAWIAIIILLRFSTPINKNTVAAWLGILFLFAYLMSPYWLLVSDYEKTLHVDFVPESLIRFIAFTTVAALGLLWSQLAASAYKKDELSQNNNRPLELLWPLLLAVILLLFNLKAFYNVILMHTDEDHHIVRMWYIRNLIKNFLTRTSPLLIFSAFGLMLLTA